MKEAERFIRRATRGLHGQTRQDAQTELRGAVEDKVYRYTLLGLTEQDALNAALRDLGNPNDIARELGVVHVVPNALKFLLLAGLAGVLTIQAAAQIPAVRAAPRPADARDQTCDFSPAQIAQLPKEYADYVGQEIKRLGGRANAEASCRANMPQPNQYLRLSDFVSALRAGGVGVQESKDFNGFLELTFPGQDTPQTLNLNSGFEFIGGEAYITKFELLKRLRSSLDVPLKLTGLDNPVLSIGPAKLQLGTPATPIRATDLYLPLMEEELGQPLQLAAGFSQSVRLAMLEDLKLGNNRAAVSGGDGALYVTLDNSDFLPEKKACGGCNEVARTERFYTIAVRTVQGGKIAIPPRTIYGQARPLSSPQELFQAAAKRQAAFLTYKLDASDLRHLKLTPVPAAQVKLEFP